MLSLALKRPMQLPSWLWAALAYLIITLIVTYPAGLNLTTRIAGESGFNSDALEFVWSMWWWKHALLDLRQSPVHVSLLNYPTGIEFPLLPLMAQSFLIGLPFTALVSPVFAYNILFLSSFVLCGLSAYWLCSELSGDRLAGFVGGLIWAFFPNKTGHALTGHLFQLVVFAFPLLALAWARLLKTPTTRTALWAALATALAATVHPIYLAYFILPILILLVGGAIWIERRAFWTRERIRALSIVGGLCGLLLFPLIAPALIQTARGDLAYLAPQRGAVELSLDLLGYFLPPPNNPFLQLAIAPQVVTRENETIATIGWLAIALGIVGARRIENRAWVWATVVGGIMALGPLLKIGGQIVSVPVELERYPIPLPYAFVGNLPFFNWSRTPARWDALTMLGVAVLAASGFASLIGRPTLTRYRWALVVAAALLVPAEYLVKFPFPTLPAGLPAPVLALRADSSDVAVITLPKPDNEANLRALYWQTAHAHPLIGGRVYRDVPGGEDHYWLISYLLLNSGNDMIPRASDEQRQAVLSALNVGWVLYDASADLDGSARAVLIARFGNPVAEDEAAALFANRIENPSVADSVWALGPGWPASQSEATGRRLEERSVVYIFNQDEREQQLTFTATPSRSSLQVTVNGESVGRWRVGVESQLRTDGFTLGDGLNVVEFVVEPQTPSPVIDNVRLTAPVEGDDIFGEAIRLADYEAPTEARRGESFAVRLTWESLAPIDDDLIAFVHVLDADGNLAAQSDSQPMNGAYPTSQWSPGDRVVYAVQLTIPADAPSGAYRLRIGLYRWPSLERLPVADADAVDLGTVTVKP